MTDQTHSRKNIFSVITVAVIVIFVISVLFIGFSSEKNSGEFHQGRSKGDFYSKASVSIAGKTILADISDTPDKLSLGLSGRNSLPDGAGMLFIFPDSDKYSFWMKDMLFPIDIIWIDENFKVSHIEKSVSPETYPETFTPTLEAKYVLEVEAGFSQRNNLKVGDRVEFRP